MHALGALTVRTGTTRAKSSHGILILLLCMAAGCSSTPPPYVAEIWQAGSFAGRNGPGWKGGSVTYEQLVLLDNGNFSWTQTRCGLMPTPFRFTNGGTWGRDLKGTYLLDGTNRLYLSDARAQGGHPYHTNRFIRVFAGQEAGAAACTNQP